MPTTNVQGTSLVEMLVSLTLLELLAVVTLHVIVATERIARNVASGSATDMARLESTRLAATDPACLSAPGPMLIPLAFAAEANRAPVTVLLRCGH